MLVPDCTAIISGYHTGDGMRWEPVGFIYRFQDFSSRELGLWIVEEGWKITTVRTTINFFETVDPSTG